MLEQYCTTISNLMRVKASFVLSGKVSEVLRIKYSDPSLYRASPIAASLLRGIFYSAFFTVNPDWLRGFTVV